MAEYVLLDAGPLGLACQNPARPAALQCHHWMSALSGRGIEIVIPEIADYEVRRELIRIGAVSSIHRLVALVASFALLYAAITTEQMRQAAGLWADARQRGFPTAHPHALDADVILAACAATIGQPGDQIMVATDNVGHLGRYCDARLWTTIK